MKTTRKKYSRLIDESNKNQNNKEKITDEATVKNQEVQRRVKGEKLNV